MSSRIHPPISRYKRKQKKDLAINYLHNNSKYRSFRPAAYSCKLTLSRTLSRNALLYLASLISASLHYFFFLLKVLHRNIFVLGPAQLCISRNDDGSYDVTVLAGRQELRSLNKKGFFQGK